MKKLFGKGGIKGFLGHHCEKMLLGVALLVGLLLIFKGWSGRTGMDGNYDPATLKQKVSSERSRQSAFKKDDFIERWEPMNFSKRADAALTPIKPASYVFRTIPQPPLIQPRTKRTDPVIYPAETLIARSAFGAVSEPVERPKRRAEKSKENEREEILNAGRPKLEEGERLIPTETGSAYGGRGGGGGYGAEGGGYAGSGAGTKTRGRHFMVITGLVPMRKQVEQYNLCLADASDYDPRRDIPYYDNWILERAEVVNGKPQQWRPIANKFVAQRKAREFGVATLDPVAGKYKDRSLTMPAVSVGLPREQYEELMRHDQIPTIAEEIEARRAEWEAKRAEKEAEKDSEELDMFEGGPAAGGQPGGGGYGAEGGGGYSDYGGGGGGGYGAEGGGGYSDYGGGGGGYGAEGGGGGYSDYGGGGYGAEGGGGYSDYGGGGGGGYGDARGGGGYGAEGGGYGSGGGGGYGAEGGGGGYAGGGPTVVVRPDPEDFPEFKMFRYIDFEVAPGKSYQYRLALWIEDPNEPDERVKAAPPALSLDASVITRIRARKPLSEKEKTRIKNRYWRETEKSEFSNIAKVGSGKTLLAGTVTAVDTKNGVPRFGLEPSAEVIALDFDPRTGTRIPAKLKVMRGSAANLYMDAEMVIRHENKLKMIEDHHINFNATVMDLKGGEKLGVGDLTAPGELLVFQDGKLTVVDELDAAEQFQSYDFEPPVDEEALAAEREAEEKRAERAAGRGRRGRGGGGDGYGGGGGYGDGGGGGYGDAGGGYGDGGGGGGRRGRE